MKFLADENVDAALVAHLRACGHDATYAAETHASMDDAHLMDVSVREKRTIITFDRDFGELVFMRKREVYGIVYIRSKDESLEGKRAVLDAVLNKIQSGAIRTENSFIAATGDKIRHRRL